MKLGILIRLRLSCEGKIVCPCSEWVVNQSIILIEYCMYSREHTLSTRQEMLLPETNHFLHFVPEGIPYVTSTPKIISSVRIRQKSSNLNILKSSRANISRPSNRRIMQSSQYQKSLLPVLSISRKVAVTSENEAIPLRKVYKSDVNERSLLKAGRIALPEEGKSNIPRTLDTSILNLSGSKSVQLFNPHSTAENVQCEAEFSQDIEMSHDDYDSDGLTASTHNFDNYVDVEAVSDGENTHDAAENQEDALSEMQLAKTTVDDSTSHERRIACPNACGNFFYIKSALQKHIKYNCGKQYPSQSYRFKCWYCDSRSEYSYSIMRHISKHHKMVQPRVIDTWRNEILEKKEAPVKEPDPNNPTGEGTSEQKIVKQHDCPNKCGSSFDHVYNISRHIRRTCPKVQRYQCPYCRYRTRTFLLVTKHIEINHRLNKVCAINVFTKQIVYRDIRRRSKITKKENTITSTKIGNLSNPEAGGSNEESAEKKKKQRFQCPNDCGLAFNYKHTLDNHLRFVCGKLRFKCPYCIKKCRQEWGAIIHIKHRHPGRKNFVVDVLRKKVIYDSGGVKYCNDFDAIQDQKTREEFEKAKSEAAFAKQKQQHHNDQPQLPTVYRCPHCNKLCKHAWNLSMHIKFRHPNVKNYHVPLDVPPSIKSEDRQEDIQDKDLPRHLHGKDVPDVQETERSGNVQDFFDETGAFSENASEVGYFDILEDNKELLAPCLSSLASAELSLDPEAMDTSVEPGSTFKSPIKGRKNFFCPNNCGSLIKYEYNLTRHLQYRCKQRANMSSSTRVSHTSQEESVIDNESSRELPDEAETAIVTETETATTTDAGNSVVVKKEPLEVDSTPPE